MSDREEVDFRICVYHHEHKSIMERNGKDIQDLWKSIDTMKTWVILGSGSMVLTLMGVAVQVFLHFNK